MCLFKDFSLSHWFLAICAKCALIFFVYLAWGLLSYVDLTVFNRFGHFSAIIFSEIFLPPLILFLQLQCVKLFDPWVQKISWRRAWHPTPVFLPGEAPWTEVPGRLQSMGGRKESDTTEWLSTNFHIVTQIPLLLISFRIDWVDLLAVQGTPKSLLQHHSSKASVPWCSAFFVIQLSHLHVTTGKTIALTI